MHSTIIPINPGGPNTIARQTSRQLNIFYSIECFWEDSVPAKKYIIDLVAKERSGSPDITISSDTCL